VPKALPTLPSTLDQRRSLLARIHRQFETFVDEIDVGPYRFNFTRVKDPNLVLDQVAAKADLNDRLLGKRQSGDVLGLPYWAEIWDSSYGVGQYLTQILSNARDRCIDVLDLGCGMGFTGMVAAAMGARVTLADLEPPALLFARLNAIQFSADVQTRRLNWRTDRFDERFDLIIGADILYEKTQWDHLEPFWRAHLKPEGTVLLGEPGRQTGDLFLPWIKPRHWQLERFEEPVITRAKPIRLLRLRAL
jgi:predicted nicotinamide N-methyase